MAHFAGATLNPSFGLGAQLSTAINTALEATASTSTEGTNKLTYTVPATGMYRVNSYLKVTVASDAATSHTAVVQVAYNNGSAIAAADLKDAGGTGVTVGTMNVKGTAGTTILSQQGTVYAVAGTTITLTVSEAIAGAKTAGVGSYMIQWSIAGV